MPARRTQIVPEPDSAALPVPIRGSAAVAAPRLPLGHVVLVRRRRRWCCLPSRLGIFDLIKDFFARNAELGWLGLALVILAALSLAVIGIREAAGLLRLANVEHLHQRAADVHRARTIATTAACW